MQKRKILEVKTNRYKSDFVQRLKKKFYSIRRCKRQRVFTRFCGNSLRLFKGIEELTENLNY